MIAVSLGRIELCQLLMPGRGGAHDCNGSSGCEAVVCGQIRIEQQFLNPRSEECQSQDLCDPRPRQSRLPRDLRLTLDLTLVDQPVPPVGEGKQAYDSRDLLEVGRR
jgi:hypothetical protein